MSRWAAFMVMLILAVLVVLPLISIFGVQFHRHEMKKSFHENAENIAAEVLLLPVSSFNALKKGDEIDYNNKRYDIKSVKRIGAYWKTIAVDDKLEKLLETVAKKEIPGKEGIKLCNLPDWFFLNMSFKDFVIFHSKLILWQTDVMPLFGFNSSVFQPPEV